VDDEIGVGGGAPFVVHCISDRLAVVFGALLVVGSLIPTPAAAQTSQPADEAAQSVEEGKTTGPSPDPAADKPMSIDYYVKPRGYGTQPETEPPRYVRTLSKTGIPELKEFYWLDFGVDHRTRFEYRDDDFRKDVLVRDTPFLMRSRAYVGIKEILDPLRFGVEFQDARQFNSQFPPDNRDVDENDIIQLFGELYFKDALGPDRPLRLQAGRLAFEYIDRRLISRNPWRNTTNNFDGFRAILGQEKNDWQLDILAVQPVERLLTKPDRTNEEEWFYGVIGNWRRWSKIVTLQPYYLIRDQDRKDPTARDREIHTLGLRGYGLIGDTGLDYDVDVAWQFGDDGSPKQRAWAFASELGYTFEHEWKPRVSAFCGYASGDRNPLDNVSEHFDRLFGFARPWSAEDYFIWENLIAPKARLEFEPYKTIKFDTGYGAYWLASDSDAWPNAQRRDPLGDSGDFIGQELDVRMRWQVDPRVELIFGYAHFMPGPFADNTGPSDDSDFFYVEANVQLFK
jgi:hypothetical protein